MIQTPVRWKFHIRNFLNLLIDSVNAPDFLVSGHVGPHMLQLNAISVLHNDVFGPD